MLALLGACGDDGGAPTTTKLHGWWSFEDERKQTVFGFVSADEIATTVDTEGVTIPPGVDLAVVYTQDASVEGMVLVQMSSYEVVDGILVQTVIADIGSPPGTRYGTDILELDDTHLTLESTNDPSGKRTYTYSPRCPSENTVGWAIAGIEALMPGESHDPAIHDPALAIDGHGHVHSLMGSASKAQYAFLGNGCRPLLERIPAARKQAIALIGDEVHTLLETISDGSVIHRWRTAPGAAWQMETVIPATTSTFLYHLKLFVDGTDLVIVASRTDGTYLQYRRDSGGWHVVPVVIADPQRRVEEATFGGGGEIVLMTLDRIRRIRGTMVEDILLPRPQYDYGVNGSVRVDAMGRIHAAWGFSIISSAGSFGGLRSVYGIYDGTWELHELGPMMYPRVITTPDGPMRVIGSEHNRSALTLTELHPDGTMTSEVVSDGGTVPAEPFTAGLSLDAVQSANGMIATSFSSQFVQVRFPERLRLPRTASMTLRFFPGMGRAYTDDGLIDCSAECTKTVPLGKRAQLKLTPAMPSYQGNLSTCLYADAYKVEGWCWADLVGPYPLKPVELSVSFFPP